MGREIRRLPLDWQHPTDENGDYIPQYLPVWTDDTELGYCLYENVSEGTPCSPIFPTRDELINWIRDAGYSWIALEHLIEFGFCFSGYIITKEA